jgi:prepilin-type N-terminal cleavage/methylation domain-containing protein
MMGGLYHLRILHKKLSEMKRSYVQSRNGFTIVETMIVLAITGILFVSVVTVMSGRQGKAQFQQSINAVKTEIEQIITEVQTGYYPNPRNFNCTIGPSGAPVITGSTSANEQGSNMGCVFMGKTIQFLVTDGGSERYAIYPLAGLQTATSFAATQVKAVGHATETKMLQYGIQPSWVQPATGSRVGALSFVTSFESSPASTEVRGSQSIQIRPVPSSSLNNMTVNNAQAIIDANAAAGSLVNGAKICYQSGTTSQHGIVSISGGGTVSLKINSGSCPA